MSYCVLGGVRVREGKVGLDRHGLACPDRRRGMGLRGYSGLCNVGGCEFA